MSVRDLEEKHAKFKPNWHLQSISVSCRLEKDAEFPQSADGLEGDNPVREMSCLNEQAVQSSGGN